MECKLKHTYELEGRCGAGWYMGRGGGQVRAARGPCWRQLRGRGRVATAVAGIGDSLAGYTCPAVLLHLVPVSTTRPLFCIQSTHATDCRITSAFCLSHHLTSACVHARVNVQMQGRQA